MKIVAQNRRAKYDYEIIDTVEAGIQLSGQEVKSCRAGHMNLAGSYVSFLSGAPMLKQATIAPYVHASNTESYEPARDRLLLLKKTEMDKLQSTLDERGVALIPLEVRAGRYIKVLLGLGRGKKRLDKRQKIKERDVSRKLRRGQDY